MKLIRLVAHKDETRHFDYNYLNFQNGSNESKPSRALFSVSAAALILSAVFIWYEVMMPPRNEVNKIRVEASKDSRILTLVQYSVCVGQHDFERQLDELFIF